MYNESITNRIGGNVKICLAFYRKFKSFFISKDLLEDITIMKVGVDCQRNRKFLTNDYKVEVNGTYDLRFLAVKADVTKRGLEKLSLSVSSKTRDEDWQISASDWEATQLTQRQIDYAADDSCASFKIFKTLYTKVTRKSRPSNLEIMDFCRAQRDNKWLI